MLPLVLALLLSGTPRPSPLRAPHIRSSGGLSHTLPSTGASSLALSFLPTSGVGMPTVGDLCDLYASEMTGAFLCQRGDGTVSSGSQALTAVGAPSTVSQSRCPNGLNCNAVSEQVYAGAADAYKTANVAGPSGDFTVCTVATLEASTTGNNVVVGKDNGNVPQRSAILNLAVTGTTFGTQATICSTSTCGTNCGNNGVSTAMPLGSRNLICWVYDFVTDGTSTLSTYINGVVNGTPTTTCPGPMYASAGVPWFIGARNDAYSPDWMKGRTNNTFITEKVLTAATMIAMAHTALADNPTGTKGEVLTFSRSSSRMCDPGDGGVLTTLPTDRPCVAGGLSIEPAATNLVLRSRDLSNATWTKTNATCALTATGVDGVPASASTCTATAGNATVLQGITVAASTRALSLAVRRRTGTGVVNVTRDNGGTWTAVTLTAAFQRFTPQTTAALSSGGANPTVGIQIVTNGDAVDVDYVQDEDGAFATSPILTAGTSVTRSAESADLAMPGRMADSAGCVGLTVLLDHIPPNSFPRMLALSTNGYLYFGGTSTEVDAYDGTNFATANTGSTIAGASNRYMLDWSGATLTLTAAGVVNSTSYDGTIVGSTVSLGRYASGAHLGGTISNVKLGTKTGVCP